MIGLRESFVDPDAEEKKEEEWIPRFSSMIDSIFAATGALCATLGLEHRPQQERMAQAVAGSITRGEPLLFEAGTGVGKSLAYLIPMLLAAHLTKRQGVVSSHTIALQEQIKHKDLRLCRELFHKVPELSFCKDFRTALLVGRGNYLCGHRLAQALNQKSELFETPEQAELERIADWSKQSLTGLRHELAPSPHPEVWELVNADSSACNNRNCKADTCFYRKARAEIAKAHLVIVNHSLLFALIGAGAGVRGKTPGILFPNDFVVLDEAHTVPAIASDHAGEHVSSYGLARLLRLLYNPRTQKGMFRRYGRMEDCQAAEETYDASVLFFNQVRDHFLLRKAIARVYESPWAEPILDPLLEDLSQRVGSCLRMVEDESEINELQDLRKRLGSYRVAIASCLDMEDPHAVYWVEKSGRQGQIIHLRTAPLDVAPFLRETLFTRKSPVILTSATLADGTDMEGFSQRTGAESARAIQVQSPFDFERNMRVYVAADSPAPDRTSGALNTEFLVDSVRFCVDRCRGGSLVLFTSYRDLQEVTRQIDPVMRERGRTVLAQGRDGGRTEIANRFRELGNAVLCGTDSFWTGIDVPGASLAQVIITRLPFENPSHPVVEARTEWIRQQGMNPFQEITLPDALIKFRQGIGRLIRNKQDRGTITILDSRVLKKTYGRRFLDVLPTPHHTRFTRQDRDWVFQPLDPSAD